MRCEGTGKFPESLGPPLGTHSAIADFSGKVVILFFLYVYVKEDGFRTPKKTTYEGSQAGRPKSENAGKNKGHIRAGTTYMYLHI